MDNELQAASLTITAADLDACRERRAALAHALRTVALMADKAAGAEKFYGPQYLALTDIRKLALDELHHERVGHG